MAERRRQRSLVDSSGAAVLLARISADDDIDAGEAVSAEVIEAGTAVNSSDILVAPHVRPVLLQHRPTKWIDLHLPLDLETRSLQPQVESADAGE
jgi:hypothetical protein